MTVTKILVVEGELIVGEHLRVVLKTLGYQVGEVLSSGEQALQAAEAERPHLVLMDIGLKGEMDGVEAARSIQGSLDIPVVYLTAGSDPAALRRATATATESFGYVVEPYQEQQLHATIEMALHKHGLEKHLRESEKRFRQVVENSEAGYFFIDRNGCFQDVNNAWLRMHRYDSPDEVIGHHFALTQVDMDIEAAKESVAHLLGGAEIPTGEFSRRCKDGSIGYHVFSASPVVVAGETIGLEGFLLDITGREQAEQALRQSERSLRIRSQINSIFLTRPDEVMYAEVLKVILEVMESEFVTFGYFARDGSFVVPAMSREIYWEQCNVPEKEIIFQKGTFVGIWERAVKERKTLISNDGPLSTPEGHIPIKNTMVAPIIFRDEVISAIHVANKPGGYGEEDREMLEDVAGQIAPVLYARLERDKQDEERKQAEQALQLQSEIATNMAEGVYLIRISDVVIVYANPRFEEMFGYDQGEMVGKHASIVNAPTEKDPEETAKEITEFLEREGYWRGEVNNIKKDGTPFWCYASVTVFDHPEHGSSMVAVHTDITERQQAEDELASSELMLQNSQRIGRIGSFEMDIETGRVKWSDQLFDLFGMKRTKGPIDNHKVLELIHPDDRERAIKVPSEAAQKGEPYELEHRVVHPGGKVLDLLIQGDVIRNDKNEVIKTAGTVQDITERVQAEEALKASEARYQDLYENAPDMFVSVNTETATIIQCNQTLATALGCSKEEIIGRPISDVYHPDSAEYAEKYIHPIFVKTGELHDVELQLQRKDGSTIDVTLSISAVRDKQGKILFSRSSWRDITERKKMEAAMLESQKLAALGTLAAGIAHEINSPLQVITGSTDSLLRRIEGDKLDMDDLPGSLGMISRNAWRVAELVRSLLAFARPSEGMMEPHDINALVKDTLLLIAHQLRTWSNITVSTDLSPDLPPLRCDREKVSRVLINLLSNARDAMPEQGGEIAIRTAYDAGEEQILLSVSDSGRGIADEVRSKIFDPFYTTKPVGDGTGLGLSIVSSIVQAHGGIIDLQSAPGQGTIFNLRFPLHPPQETPASTADDVTGRY